MRMKNNYHTHLKYCGHATGVTEDYVKEAIRLGFDELAITDHGPIPVDFMNKQEYKDNYCYENMKLEFVPKYLNEVKESKELHKNEIKILSGFETEFIYDRLPFYKFLREQVDFINLGVHFFKNKKGHIIDCYNNLSYRNIDEYKDTCIKAMETGLFNTLVHPDMFFCSYKDKNGENKFDENCERISKEIIEAAIKNNVYLEVNCNNIKTEEMAANPNSWRYPRKEFWMIAKEYKDLKIIVGCDAHAPERLLGFHVDAIYKFIDDLGLNVLDKMEINH
ncbi:MAG: PHP domain-containing protein [Acholeplasmatales bacterium]|nr:PHP domain-containing protein [Acholeplasmatales bacterium]